MFRFVHRLHTQIFLLFMLMLLLIQSISFWFTYSNSQQLARQQMANRLSVAQLVFTSKNDHRNYYLETFAATAAEDPDIQSLFDAIDRADFEPELYLQRKHANADIALALSKQGETLGLVTFDRPTALSEKAHPANATTPSVLFNFDQELTETTQLFHYDGYLYQTRFAPVIGPEGTPLGWVGFGYIIGNELANSLSSLTGLNAGFLLTDFAQDPENLAFSSPGVKDQGWQAVVNYIQNDIANFKYILWKGEMGRIGDRTLMAYMFLEREVVLAKLKRQWGQQLLLILLVVPLSLSLAYWLSRSVTRPIKALADQARSIAQGEYDQVNAVGTSLELRSLAKEFGTMRAAILDREQRIHHQAQHDPLTQLSNRFKLESDLDSWIKEQLPVSLLLINIRHIFDVNITLGHQVGDNIIKAVSQSLLTLNGPDLVSRLSCDDFVLAFKQLDPEQIPTVLEAVYQCLEVGYIYESLSLNLEATIGISHYVHGVTPIDLIRQADTALHSAKANRIPFQIYDQALDQETQSGFQLLNELKQAIDANQLVLHFQPKLSLVSGYVDSVEALVRWQHPDRGLIYPDVFIPLAEKAGQLNALSRWVYREVLRQLALWQSQGTPLRIAINLSASNLAETDFCQWLLDTTTASMQNPANVTIEITEDAVVSDPDGAVSVLNQWRNQGFQLSVDDYGTGYSSLAQLKKLPVDELKIDKSFIMDLTHDPQSQVIVRSTIQLAHSLSMQVVAEGVETPEVMAWLANEGCERVQGYFISKPVPADTLIPWLIQSGYRKPTED